MKKSICLSIFIFFVLQMASAQTLSLELSPQSKERKLGNSVWYFLYITNDTNKPLVLFNSPQKEFNLAGYEYTVYFNDEAIITRSTSGLDTNERFRDNRVSTLPPGEKKLLIGLREFPLKEKGTYRIEYSYYQDASNVNNKYAQNGKAKKAVKSLTPFKVKTVEEFIIE